MEQLLDAWGRKTLEQRAETVKWLLEKQADGSRVFYYRQWYAEPEEDADPDAAPEIQPKVRVGCSFFFTSLMLFVPGPLRRPFDRRLSRLPL